MPESFRIICVGTPPELLESRKLVLKSAGYDAVCSSTEEATSLLLTSVFDAMILSVSLSEEERTSLRQAVSDRTRIIQLTGFTAPAELLALVRS
jgi:DNA-binding response OmpR family regulator